MVILRPDPADQPGRPLPSAEQLIIFFAGVAIVVAVARQPTLVTYAIVLVHWMIARRSGQ